MAANGLASGLAVVGAIGAAAVGLTTVTADIGGGHPATVAVQPVVTGVPLPLDPPPTPAPVEPVLAPQVAPAAPAPAPQPGAPLPTPDEVSSMLTKLTDAGISYKEKGNLVENGITQQDGHVLDHDLRKAYRDGELPYTFEVSNIEPTGPNQAAANLTMSGPKMAPQTKPIMLVDQGGTWVLSHDSAVALTQAISAP